MTTLTRSTSLRTTLRERKCVICAERFKQAQPMQSVCGVPCAIAQGQKATAMQAAKQVREKKAAQRADRVATKAALEKLKTKGEWLADLQRVFNAFIRERDAHLPCISCGRFHTGSYDAGHYRSVGAQPALRFHEDNCHKQCVPCNQHKSGNVVEYRLGLIARIGAERVAFLEQEHAPAKFTIDEAKAIKAHYIAKLRELKETA
jgi:hypothetical protein